MRRTAFAITAVFAILLTRAAIPQTSGVTALVGGRLIDGYGGKPLENSVVIVQDGRIKEVGRMGEVAVPAGAQVISTEGMSVLPGLWDMHVHLMIVGHADYEHWDRTYPPLFRSTIMPAAAKQLLLAGVTSARDLGAPLEDILAAIRIVAAGEALIAPSVTRRLIAEFVRRSPLPGQLDSGALDELTDREREVVALAALGLNNHEIAEELVISPATARTHVSRAMVKVGARDRAQLVVLAYQSGLVEPLRRPA